MTNVRNLKCEFEDCHILVTNYKITLIQKILNILEYTNKQNKPLVIIAEDIEGEALTTLI
jgi:chaperonin GroEL